MTLAFPLVKSVCWLFSLLNPTIDWLCCGISARTTSPTAPSWNSRASWRFTPPMPLVGFRWACATSARGPASLCRVLSTSSSGYSEAIYLKTTGLSALAVATVMTEAATALAALLPLLAVTLSLLALATSLVKNPLAASLPAGSHPRCPSARLKGLCSGAPSTWARRSTPTCPALAGPSPSPAAAALIALAPLLPPPPPRRRRRRRCAVAIWAASACCCS